MDSMIDTALGVNEIVTAIMARLPKKDLKSARLVNRTWASLGGQQLIGKLYISPREIDMAVFDSITQHPDLSKSVKHLVYDSAQFFKFSDPLQPSADHVHSENCQCLVKFKANVCHEAFMEGYLQYSLHAQERSNIFRPSWINRVLSGLKSIGSINAVILRNTWNDIYRAEEAQ
ncbi:MAG: hypothetical protein Q9180_007908, partial [Flavoplaca navasiana]